jgi:hypothetical protein
MKEPHRPCCWVGSHCRSPARRQLRVAVPGIAVAYSSIKVQFQTYGRGQTQPPPPHSPETTPRMWSVEVNCRGKVDHPRHRVLYTGSCVSFPTLGVECLRNSNIASVRCTSDWAWVVSENEIFLGITFRSEWIFPSSSSTAVRVAFHCEMWCERFERIQAQHWLVRNLEDKSLTQIVKGPRWIHARSADVARGPSMRRKAS